MLIALIEDSSGSQANIRMPDIQNLKDIRNMGMFARITGRIVLSATLAGILSNASSYPQGLPTFPRQDPPELLIGKSFEREFQGRISHRYCLKLGPDQYVRIVVDQRGVDVVLSLFSQVGNKLVEVDTPNGRWGPETLIWVTEDFGGTYFLDVTSYDPKAPRGLYTARIDELRPATDQDRHRFSGQSAYEEARVFYSQGDYARSERSNRRALEQLELAVGPQGFELVKVLVPLAHTYELQEQYSVAEAFYTRALDIQEEALGSQDAEAARNFVQIAGFYINEKEFAQADKLLARAAAISEQLRLPEDRVMAQVWEKRADELRERKKMDESESLYLRALAIYQKAGEPDEESIGSVQAALARLRQMQGKNVEAQQLYLSSLPSKERGLGPFNPELAIILTGLAETYMMQDAFSKAEPLYRRALALREKTLGAEHPDVASTLEAYAAVERKMKREADADRMEARARAIRAKAVTVPK